MSRAVFLSYSSDDAESAARICETLRAAGIEVWFDRDELVGGDAWDQKIRRQIRDCALFVPIVSASTQARTEGYFRLEWRLAEQRTHLMAKGRPFLLPIVIDATTDGEAHVPDSFLEVQWSRFPGGQCDPGFASRVRQMLSGEIATAPAAGSGAPAAPASEGRERRSSRRRMWIVVPLVIWAVAWVAVPLIRKALPSKSPAASARAENSSDALVAKARALVEDPMAVNESYRAAEDLCARAVSLDPQDAVAWAVCAQVAIGLAASYNDRSERQKAVARSRAERAIRLAPDSLEAGLAMAGYELFVEGDSGVTPSVVAAEKRLRALRARYPADRRVLLALGDAVGSQGRFEDAIALYEECHRLPGGDANALMRKAWTLRAVGRAEDGVKAADESIALRPSTQAYGAKLILLYGSVGDLERTRAVIESLPPAQLREDRVAWVAWNVWMKLRQPDKAAEALRRIDHDFIREGRIAMPTRYGLGEAQRLAGRANAAAIEYEAALATVNQRLQADPSSAELAGWKTLLLARLGRMPEARQWHQTTLELRGIKPGDLSRSGPVTLIALGRLDDAVTSLELRVRAGSRDSQLLYLPVDPAFDPLRKLPRFQALLKAYLNR